MYICTCTDNLYVRTAQGRDQPCPTSTIKSTSCVFYYLDDDTSKHVLQLENYTKEWVLLQATV